MNPEDRAQEIRSVMTLGCVPGVGTRGLWRILDHFGSASRAVHAPPAALDAVAHLECGERLASVEIERRVREALERCRATGIEILLWTDEHYPSRLDQLADPPPILFARGRLELLETPAVTIVGSRRSTAYGRRAAGTLAAQLAFRRITVVSGLALGIDGAAHRGALDVGGDTIAVLGSGVDLIQPASHRRLGQQIAAEGLLISEFLPGEPARAHHFPRRNRILAALADAVVVVEAAEKSGAFITVEHALDVGRDVYAVPGALDAPQSRGCDLLIRQGAQVVTSAEEFVQDLGVVCGSSGAFRERLARPGAGPSRAERRGGRGAGSSTRPAKESNPLREVDHPSSDPPIVPSGLDEESGCVWLALGASSIGIDDVVTASKLQSAKVLAALTRLQVAGLVVQEAGMRFRRVW